MSATMCHRVLYFCRRLYYRMDVIDSDFEDPDKMEDSNGGKNLNN